MPTPDRRGGHCRGREHVRRRRLDARLRAGRGAAVLDRRDHGAAARRKDRRGAAAGIRRPRSGTLVPGGVGHHDHGHGAQRRVAPDRDRQRAGDRYRHRQGIRHDSSRHGDDAGLHRDRRADCRGPRDGNARDRRRLVQLRDHRRRYVDQRQLVLAATQRARWRSPTRRSALPASRRDWRWPRSRRRSSATARAPPSSSPCGRGWTRCRGMPANRIRHRLTPRQDGVFASDPNLAGSSARSATRPWPTRPGARVLLARRGARSRERCAPSYTEEAGQR